jgi:uncharacterized membrane protein
VSFCLRIICIYGRSFIIYNHLFSTSMNLFLLVMLVSTKSLFPPTFTIKKLDFGIEQCMVECGIDKFHKAEVVLYLGFDL